MTCLGEAATVWPMLARWECGHRVVRSYGFSRETGNSYIHGKSPFITLLPATTTTTKQKKTLIFMAWMKPRDTSFCPELGRKFLLWTKLGSLRTSEHGFLTQLTWVCLGGQGIPV